MWRRAATAAGVGAALAATAVVRIPAVLSDQHIDFDEGVYGVSVLAMRDGGLPFRDIFSSQGPLFLPILWLFDVAGLRHFRAMRLGMVLVALAFTVGVYVIARRVSGSPFAAVVAAAATGTASAGVAAAGAIHSDGIGLAFGVWGVAVLVGAGSLDERWRPLVVGLLIGAGMAVKSLFLVPAGLAVAWHYGWRREWGALVRAAVAAALLGLAVTLPWGLGNVWEQFVAFHLDVPRTRSPYRNFVASVGRMWRRDSIFLVMAGAALGGVAIRLARRRWPDGPRADHVTMLVWLAASAAVLLLGVEMDRGSYRFLIFFIAPAMVVLAIFRPPAVLLAAAVAGALLLVPRHYHENDRYLEHQRLNGRHAEVVALLRALPEGANVVADDPGLAWVAGRHPPPPLVDVSWARIQSGSLRADAVREGAARADTCAVVFFSDRFDFLDPDLGAGLAGYELAVDWGSDDRLYVREECRP